MAFRQFISSHWLVTWVFNIYWTTSGFFKLTYSIVSYPSSLKCLTTMHNLVNTIRRLATWFISKFGNYTSIQLLLHLTYFFRIGMYCFNYLSLMCHMECFCLLNRMWRLISLKFTQYTKNLFGLFMHTLKSYEDQKKKLACLYQVWF